jgi:4-hydroxybenzoate polyprenyltransferase
MATDSPRDTPLVVDLDGTLTPTDTLVESLVVLLKQSPLNLLRLPWWLLKGRARFKHSVASRCGVLAEQLPYHEPLLLYLRGEKQTGRRIILATAAHESIAAGVSAHLNLFDAVLSTGTRGNLKGQAKLQAIRDTVGDRFVYAGNSGADVPIWKAAEAAILVGVPPAMAAGVRGGVPIETEFPRERLGLRPWLRALRVHQWLKNLLLFVPLLTAFSFTDTSRTVAAAVAFMAFSLAASATYILNDLGDLENDRAHPRKRLRPFACGQIPILQGVAAAAVAMVVAFAIAFTVSRAFVLTLLAYVALTSAYSWRLKQLVLFDVIVLSLLYTLRIVAGSVATGIAASSWLLAFSVFVFLSLALVKRCAELFALKQTGKEATRGRDYRVADLTVLWPLGLGSALSAVVVFGLFISAPETQGRYATPQLLWLVAIQLIYWLSRLWIKTSRGEMHDDPVIFAFRDKASLATVFAMLVTVLAAHFVSFGSPI